MAAKSSQSVYLTGVALMAALLLPGSRAIAAEVITTTALAEPLSVVLRGQRIDRAADPITRVVQVPAVNTIPLPEGLWEIRVDDEKVWAPRMYLRDADSVSLQVWPAVPLRGVTKGVKALTVAFTPLVESGVRGQADCSVTDGSWTCAIPQGRYDLRFNSPGFAPEYRFGVMAPNSAEIPLQFVAGASLSGRLEAARGTGIPLEGVELSLNPDGAASQQRYTTKSTAKGFFQFKGLPPGGYSLRARLEGFTAQTRAVTIIATTAAELDAPLLLDRPRSLRVNVVPSLDPDLKPWRVSLWSLDPGTPPQLAAVSESSATADGEWRLTRVIAGDYRVYVSRADGQPWASQDTTIADADVSLTVPAFGERVSGVITFGGRPLSARLSFGGERGFTLQSDDQGNFEGEIPPDDGDERTIFVEAESLGIARAVRAKLERAESGARRIVIKLPATGLIGRVVHADASPQPHAVVTVNQSGQTYQTIAGEDGTFQMTGIDAGEYRVSAETGEGRSEPVTVKLTEDSPAEVELILQSHVVVQGRVGIAEVPVIHADVYAIPRDTQWTPFMPQAKTNEHGRFQLRLPPRTTVFDLTVIHPAFDIVLSRIPVHADHVRHVVATQLGGTLVVDSPSPRDVLLRHGGGECWFHWLATRPGVRGAVESARVVVPRLEPGEYSVCSAKTKKCARGYLPPYGTLSLAID